jgi:hypothetical protein
VIGREFLFAGKAIFTVSNLEGERYTFKVEGMPGGRCFFASYLTGSDNEGDYTYLAVIDERRDAVIRTKATPETAGKIFRVLAFAVRVMLGKQKLPEGYKVQHAGRCGRCARTLTVPSSIELGLGPECATKGGA